MTRHPRKGVLGIEPSTRKGGWIGKFAVQRGEAQGVWRVVVRESLGSQVGNCPLLSGLLFVMRFCCHSACLYSPLLPAIIALRILLAMKLDIHTCQNCS